MKRKMTSANMHSGGFHTVSPFSPLVPGGPMAPTGPESPWKRRHVHTMEKCDKQLWSIMKLQPHRHKLVLKGSLVDDLFTLGTSDARFTDLSLWGMEIQTSVESRLKKKDSHASVDIRDRSKVRWLYLLSLGAGAVDLRASFLFHNSRCRSGDLHGGSLGHHFLRALKRWYFSQQWSSNQEVAGGWDGDLKNDTFLSGGHIFNGGIVRQGWLAKAATIVRGVTSTCCYILANNGCHHLCLILLQWGC